MSRRCYYLFEAVFVGSKFDKKSPRFRTVRRRHRLTLGVALFENLSAQRQT